MSDRNCENCKHHTEKGCDSWDCNFEQRMTRGKAIEVLKDLWRYEHSELSEKDIREALDIAIKAVEQEPILDKIRAEIEVNKKGFPLSSDYYKAITRAVNIIDKYRTESEE